MYNLAQQSSSSNNNNNNVPCLGATSVVPDVIHSQDPSFRRNAFCRISVNHVLCYKERNCFGWPTNQDHFFLLCHERTKVIQVPAMSSSTTTRGGPSKSVSSSGRAVIVAFVASGSSTGTDVFKLIKSRSLEAVSTGHCQGLDYQSCLTSISYQIIVNRILGTVANVFVIIAVMRWR